MNVTLGQLDATWVNPSSVQYNAQELRYADSPGFNGNGAALGVRGGIARHGDNSLAVTVNASDQVTIQPGPVVIPGLNGGCYRASLGALIAGTALEARSASLPRMDIVVFRQLDTDVVAGHGAYTGRIEVLTGTPNSTPSAGAQLPLGSMMVELGRINVPIAGGGTATVDSTYRTYAISPGGLLPVPIAARLPAAAALYDRALALDTGIQYVWSGTRWVDQSVSYAAATGNGVDSSGAFVTIPGLTINKPGGPETTYIVDASVDLTAASTASATVALEVDGVAQSPRILFTGGGGLRAMQHRRWVVRGLSDSAAHTFAVRVQRLSGTGSATAYAQHSTMTVESRTAV